MVIDRTGRLITINEAAQRILGVSAVAGEDTTFAERFMLLEHNDEFNQAILDAIYQQTVAQQKIVPFTHEGRTVVLTLTTSFLHEEVDGVRQAAGVIVVFNDITAMRELQDAQARSADELKARHRELQDAYRNIEDSNAKLAEAIGKMQAVRRVAAAFATLLIIGLAAGYWSWGGWREAAGGTPPAESPPPGAAQHTVTPRELTLNLSLTGRLSPLKTVNVSSPLNGRLASIHVRHGDTVKAGDILAVMDTTELEVKLREARSAVMRAEEGLNQLMRWDQSADVTRARRSVIRSKLALDAQKKALDEAERLFSKGIIPANELDAAKQQYITQQLDHQTAEDELASAQARGSSDQQQIARMELDNHRTRLSQYQTELTQSVVRAPVSGIVMKPPSSGNDKHTRQLAVGEVFTQGEVLLALGDLSGLLVTSKVDEVEVTKLKAGQSVTVTGEAFPGIQLNGKIRSVSAQTTESDARALPTFVVETVVDSVSDSQRQRVWVGMSALLDVQIHHEAQALVIPLSAIATDNGQHWAWKLDRPGQPAKRVPVATGHTLVDGVEITNGLSPGDVILTTARDSNQASGMAAPGLR